MSTSCAPPGLAEFPDCVAARSSKHLRELEAMAAQGDRAVVQRDDCLGFSACRDLDPTFAAALDQVATSGVEVLIYGRNVTTNAVRIARPLAWRR